MNLVLKYSIHLFFLPIWWIQLLIPRNKNIWIFGSWYGKRYSDNSKYLYEYVLKHRPDIRPIWITRDKSTVNKVKGEVYLANNLKAIYYTILAKYIFVSSGKKDINSLFSNGAIIIQLWHGSPMKKIGLDDHYSKVHSFFYQKIIKYFFPAYYEFNYQYVISNGDCFKSIYSSAFGIPIERVLCTGSPRNDAFFDTRVSIFNSNLRSLFKGCKIIYYLPTFRNHYKTNTLFNLPEYNPKRVDDFLQKNNLVLVNKGHYVDNQVNFHGGNRIINLSDDMMEDDISFMLKDADALITDYSGVYFDFLLTEKPIILAAFDLEDYLETSRGMYKEYTDVVSSPIAENWDQVLEHLKSIWNDEYYQKVVKEKNKKFNKYHDKNNSKRVVELIENL